MGILAGKKCVLAISGSIAAYKAASLCRLLVKAGAHVKVLMTDASTSFISPLTLSTLSKNQVHQNMFDEDTWNNHVELGLWADFMLVAPATANTLAKCANGLADNMLVATYLSAKCPVLFAPAMDLDMWIHGSTTHNIAKLKSYGNIMIPVGHGELASGLVGDGRMAEPEEIISFLEKHFGANNELEGLKAVVNAGPTFEAIDPVRFIGNHSSGKMGIAIAEQLSQRGAEVKLILGPSSLSPKDDSIKLIRVQDAAAMFEETTVAFESADIAVLAAAVADFTPVQQSTEKIKKKDGGLTLELKRTKDIAAHLGEVKKAHQILIGFALETQNAIENAEKKRLSKNLDFIVLNSLRDKGAGFKHDTNKVTFVLPDNKHRAFELKTKSEVANDIVDEICSLIHSKKD